MYESNTYFRPNVYWALWSVGIVCPLLKNYLSRLVEQAVFPLSRTPAQPEGQG